MQLMKEEKTSQAPVDASTSSSTRRIKHLSEKRLYSKMNISLPCPNCKDQNAKLNVYMEQNGTVLKGIVSAITDL